MVREQHRLGVLHMGVAGQDDIEVRLGLRDERAAQGHVRRHEVAAALLGEQARVGGHLVVAAAARMQARPRVADVGDERALHGHVDILVVDVEREIACLDARLHAIEPVDDGRGVRLDDARLRQHARVRLRPGDILRVQRLINRQRCPKRWVNSLTFSVNLPDHKAMISPYAFSARPAGPLPLLR